MELCIDTLSNFLQNAKSIIFFSFMIFIIKKYLMFIHKYNNKYEKKENF